MLKTTVVCWPTFRNECRDSCNLLSLPQLCSLGALYLIILPWSKKWTWTLATSSVLFLPIVSVCLPTDSSINTNSKLILVRALIRTSHTVESHIRAIKSSFFFQMFSKKLSCVLETPLKQDQTLCTCPYLILYLGYLSLKLHFNYVFHTFYIVIKKKIASKLFFFCLLLISHHLY